MIYWLWAFHMPEIFYDIVHRFKEIRENQVISTQPKTSEDTELLPIKL